MRRRYPIEALAEAMGLRVDDAMRALGMTTNERRRALAHGLVERAADRLACRAGFAPPLVWSDWHDAVMATCAAEDCTERFVPTRKGHAFCSKRCRERIRMRTAYQTNPEVRERRKAGAATYYEEAGDYVRSRMRRRHHQNRETELERMRQRYQRTKAAA